MFKHCFIFLGLCLGLPFIPANGTPLPVTDVKAMGISEVVVKGGNFYVGSVFGSEDYAAHANTSIASFAITKTEITYRQYHALQEWADTHTVMSLVAAAMARLSKIAYRLNRITVFILSRMYLGGMQ